MKKDTNTERQRLYIARLKAAAARTALLEEENAALKRKLEKLVKRPMSQPGKERS